jgi:hypothetical protein
LLLSQSDGLTYEVPFAIHPPHPRIEKLPLRLNVGEQEQRVMLAGSGLERLTELATDAGEAQLHPLESGRRMVVVKLGTNARTGDHFALRVKVQDIREAVLIEKAVEIVGPRPKISGVRTSFPPPGIELRPDEIPGGSMVSFALSVHNLEAPALAKVQVYPVCGSRQTRERSLVLSPGERKEQARLELAGSAGFVPLP